MTNKTAALRYARALLDVAVKEKAALEPIADDLASFLNLFTQNPAPSTPQLSFEVIGDFEGRCDVDTRAVPKRDVVKRDEHVHQVVELLDRERAEYPRLWRCELAHS